MTRSDADVADCGTGVTECYTPFDGACAEPTEGLRASHSRLSPGGGRRRTCPRLGQPPCHGKTIARTFAYVKSAMNGNW